MISPPSAANLSGRAARIVHRREKHCKPPTGHRFWSCGRRRVDVLSGPQMI
jgi:hypothetical protein